MNYFCKNWLITFFWIFNFVANFHFFKQQEEEKEKMWLDKFHGRCIFYFGLLQNFKN